MAKQAIRKALSLSKTFKAKKTISSINDGDYLIGDVPYQCQFATPELAKDILEKRVEAKNDPNWAIFGFKTKEESEYWTWRDCGVCCLKMALDFYGTKETIAKLVGDGVVLGGYDVEKDSGWYYKPLLELAKKYGLHGFISAYLSKYELAKNVLDKRFVIASVNPSIIRLDKEMKSTQKSGHLVLVIGFKLKNKKIEGFYINNPSGKVVETQKKAFIPIKTFTKAYGERGIVISQ
ncbi:MAG: C39 family peptidase [Patescibacteria group bacterium]